MNGLDVSLRIDLKQLVIVRFAFVRRLVQGSLGEDLKGGAETVVVALRSLLTPSHTRTAAFLRLVLERDDRAWTDGLRTGKSVTCLGIVRNARFYVAVGATFENLQF